MRRDVQAALDDDNIAGICVWQLLDIAVDPKYWPAEERPGGKNNKGVLGDRRAPKLAASAVATAFRAAT